MAIEDQPWLTEGEDKREAVKAMFGDIAPSYDLLNSLMCFRLHHRWRRLAVGQLGLKKGDSALDICSGTGDFLFPSLMLSAQKAEPKGSIFAGLCSTRHRKNSATEPC